MNASIASHARISRANYGLDSVLSTSTVTVASGSLQAGDVVVHLPADLAQRVTNWVGKTGGCKGYKKIKRGDYDAACLQANAETFIMNAMPGRLFDSFFMMQGAVVRIGNLLRAEYVDALKNAIEFATALAGQLMVDKTKRAVMGG